MRSSWKEVVDRAPPSRYVFFFSLSSPCMPSTSSPPSLPRHFLLKKNKKMMKLGALLCNLQPRKRDRRSKTRLIRVGYMTEMWQPWQLWNAWKGGEIQVWWPKMEVICQCKFAESHSLPIIRMKLQKLEWKHDKSHVEQVQHFHFYMLI